MLLKYIQLGSFEYKQSQNNFTGLTAILKMWVSINENIVIYFYYCSCLY